MVLPVIAKQMARARRGLSVTRRPLYSSGVFVAFVPPRSARRPAGPISCPSRTTADRNSFHVRINLLARPCGQKNLCSLEERRYFSFHFLSFFLFFFFFSFFLVSFFSFEDFILKIGNEKLINGVCSESLLWRNRKSCICVFVSNFLNKIKIKICYESILYNYRKRLYNNL